MIILCLWLQHYIALAALPEHLVNSYVQSNTNTCSYYNKRSWTVVDSFNVDKNGRELRKIIISNNVIEIRGFEYEH